jgi:hypothetical protein
MPRFQIDWLVGGGGDKLGVYNYESMEVGFIVFDVMALAREKCSQF